MKKRKGKGRTQATAAKKRGRANRTARSTAKVRSPRRRRRTGKAKSERDRGVADEIRTSGLLQDRISHSDSSPRLTGGDLDADWQRAGSDGEEAVGGSVATPDQDVVDEIGRALGVEAGSTAPVVPAEDVLRDRDQRRWELERRATRRERERQG